VFDEAKTISRIQFHLYTSMYFTVYFMFPLSVYLIGKSKTQHFVRTLRYVYADTYHI